MDAYQARKVIDAFETAEKILQNRPPLPKEILPSYLKMLDKIYELDQKGKVRVSDVASALHQTKPSITRALCAMDAMGWITKEDVLKVYEILKKNQYGQYLKDVLDGKYLDVLH